MAEIIIHLYSNTVFCCWFYFVTENCAAKVILFMIFNETIFGVVFVADDDLIAKDDLTKKF